MVNPYPVQLLSWLLAIAAIVVMLALAWLKWLAWRWTVMPGSVALIWVIFYGWLLFTRPAGEWAWLSAVIRVYEAAMLVSFLLFYAVAEWDRRARPTLGQIWKIRRKS